jgi:hypothetical protein
MVQPYDYTLKTPSPSETFFKSIQLGQQQQQAEAQRDMARLKRDEFALQKQFQGDVASWVNNPTPEGFRQLTSKYPSEFTALAGVQKAVGDVDRPAIRNVSVDALMAHRNNQPEQVLSILDQRIEAAQDNPQLQKRLQDMKKGYQLYKDNPKLQESGIVTVLAQDDEGAKIYDKAFKQTEPYVVAGDNLYLKSEIDRAVAESEGTGGSNINVKPLVPMGAVEKLKADPKLAVDFDKKYGTPKNPNPSILILGGQTGSAPSGNFQGQ